MSKLANALRWITTILEEERIHYEVVGGLAARAYGATRPILDIDLHIQEAGLSKILPRVAAYVTRPPGRFVSDLFDITLMALDFEGQEIELGVADDARIFDTKGNRWVPEKVNFDDSTRMEVEGVLVRVIPLERLIEYKKILARGVDLQDIEEMGRSRAP